MYIVDVNVLVYAVNVAAPDHASAHRWLNGALSGRERVGFPWMSTLGFLRISTQPRLLPVPLQVDQALDQLDEWLAAPPSTVPQPGEGHQAFLAGLLRAAGRAGNLTMDAHLAALALEHGATMVSFDRDFARFTGLRTLVPGAD